MASPNTPLYPIFHDVLHPTDFSEASLTAFHHALKAALLVKSRLTLLHVRTENDSDGALDFPAVREILERWGLLPKGSEQSDVQNLGVNVRKVVAREGNPVHAVTQYWNEHPADLLVLATHQHEGRVAWLRQSVGGAIARRSGQMTLFIPEGAPGFVSAKDGSVSLKNILVPIAETPGPQPAVDAAARLAFRLNCPPGVFTLLHVGAGDEMPTVHCPDVPGWEWRRVSRTGAVIDGILDSAQQIGADLLVMPTDGRSNFLEALRGSHTERILKQASTPLLSIPVGSDAEARLEKPVAAIQ
jgi:nucleotide-binding universal stress UspA family protein